MEMDKEFKIFLDCLKKLKEFDPRGYKEMKLELQQIGLELIKTRKNLEMPDEQELNNGVKNLI